MARAGGSAHGAGVRIRGGSEPKPTRTIWRSQRRWQILPTAPPDPYAPGHPHRHPRGMPAAGRRQGAPTAAGQSPSSNRRHRHSPASRATPGRRGGRARHDTRRRRRWQPGGRRGGGGRSYRAEGRSRARGASFAPQPANGAHDTRQQKMQSDGNYFPSGRKVLTEGFKEAAAGGPA